MAKRLVKLLTLVLVLSLVLTLLAPAAYAAEDLGSLASKEAELVNSEENRYQVTLRVPGADAVERHDEIIVMVDGSYSMDNEWTEMKQAIIEIGKTVLDGEGNTQLTLMSFGISPTVVLEHVTSVAELEASLPSLPGGLLYGRSSTNCDGAFEGIQNYINGHDGTLNEAHVIFLSDGGVNMNSSPVDWIACAEGIAASYALMVQTDELTQIALGNANVSAAAQTVFGEDLEGMIENWKTVIANEEALVALDEQIAAKEAEIAGLEEGSAELETAQAELAALEAEHAALLDAYNAAYSAVNAIQTAVDENGKTKAQQWVVEVYKSFYAYAGLEVGTAYPVHTVETAYMDYQNEYNVYFYNTFYYVLSSGGIVHDRVNGVYGTYAAASAADLAQMSKVDTLYLVRYGTDSRSGWMTGVAGTEFVQSESVSTLTAALEGVLTNLAKTPYNDVTISDYMSKWVDLDTSSVKLYDGGTEIWNAVDGWLIDEGRPTANDPVTLELVSEDGYAAGGDNVTGNTSGDVYKLTWKVKDGALVRSDNYHLTYEVILDTAETGFAYGVDLPTNGNTNVTYTDEDGTENTDAIEVPTVQLEEPEVPEEPEEPDCGEKPEKPDCSEKPEKPDCDDRNEKPDCGDQNEKPDCDDRNEKPDCDDRNEKPDCDDRNEKPDCGDRNEKPDCGDRNEKPDCGDRNEKPDCGGRNEKPDCGDRNEKPDCGGRNEKPRRSTCG